MRDHIAEASKAAGVTLDQLAPVRLTQYRQVLRRVLDTFTVYGPGGEDRLWLWEGFKDLKYVLPAEPGHALLTRIVPPDQRVWFIAEDWDGQKRDGHYWVFEGQIEAVKAVLDELFLFEYYVVDKSYGWLLCENHHNMLIGVGEPIVERMKAITLP